MKYLLFSCIFSVISYGQNTLRTADSLYRAKKYKDAAPVYVVAGDSEKFVSVKAANYYNAAYCYALSGDRPNAFLQLKKAMNLGCNDPVAILNDNDLISLHSEKEWQEILAILEKKKKELTNPVNAKFHTEDIDLFWKAYDKAMADTANRKKIFKQEYINKGSAGLQDYFASKIRTVESFERNQFKKKKFYAAIRNNTLQVKQYKNQFKESFTKFKALYDEAIFPDIYFVIGKFNSAGTVSNTGLLLGLDMQCESPDIPLDELTDWERKNFRPFSNIKNVVAHELIHSQQNSMVRDTTLLMAAIFEGMADFIGELISGKTSNERLHLFVNSKEKEKQIWMEFKKEMYLNRANNWIANSEQEIPERPADLGYYVGYKICKAFYERHADKKKAVYEMLHLKDYKEFLERSEYDQKMTE